MANVGNVMMITGSLYGDGWLQHLIHDNKEQKIDGVGIGRQTGRFEYD
jgi:hypothetical protein